MFFSSTILPVRRLLLALMMFLVPGVHGVGASDSNGGPPAKAAIAGLPPAAPDAAMTVVRMRGKDRCGSRCPEWIMAEGVITPDTPQQFGRLLATLGGAKLPVVLDSAGGDLDAALAVGRTLRALGLPTVIGRGQAEGCSPRDAACSAGRPAGLAYTGFVTPEGSCSGACLFILAGGSQRAGYWMTEATLPAPETFSTRHAGGDAEAVIGTYLAEMGISPGLVPRLRRSSLPLDREDMLHFGLATSKARVEDFTGTSICAGASPAPNCVPTAMLAATNGAQRFPARRPRAPQRGRIIVWGALDAM